MSVMEEKYFGMDPLFARQLVDRAKEIKWSKRGIDRRAYFVDDYVVLSTDRMRLRNVATRDDDLHFLDKVIETLLELQWHGIAVLPILGYCYDPDSTDGTGFMIQRRAKGFELFDDAVLARFQVWAQSQKEGVYLQSELNDGKAVRYLLSRTQEISCASQAHFDKFVSDMRCILEHDILIDCAGKSNFFYDPDEGFQFIDLDAHNDYTYGLTDQKPNIDEVVSECGFVPCLYAEETELYASNAMDNRAMCMLTISQRKQLTEFNLTIFQKCVAALRHNGISEAAIHKALDRLKIYCEGSA